MGEQVDPPDLKSGSRKGVLVRVQLGRPQHMESIRLDEDTALKAAGCKRLLGSSPRLSAKLTYMETEVEGDETPPCEGGESGSVSHRSPQINKSWTYSSVG